MDHAQLGFPSLDSLWNLKYLNLSWYLHHPILTFIGFLSQGRYQDDYSLSAQQHSSSLLPSPLRSTNKAILGHKQRNWTSWFRARIMFNLKRRRREENVNDVGGSSQSEEEPEAPRKSFFMTTLPVFACGAGLFSDGYINNVRLN
jgi:hypothetical protein